MRRSLITITAFFLLLLSTNHVFSQEMNNTDIVISGPEEPAEGAQVPEIQWIWGEISFVDAARNQLVVKYLDYENDTEKEIIVTSDDKTVFDNVASLAELKEKDTVSIDYIVNPDGVNLAKNITIEKPEDEGMPEPKELPDSVEEGDTGVNEIIAPEGQSEQPQNISQ